MLILIVKARDEQGIRPFFWSVMASYPGIVPMRLLLRWERVLFLGQYVYFRGPNSKCTIDDTASA